MANQDALRRQYREDNILQEMEEMKKLVRDYSSEMKTNRILTFIELAKSMESEDWDFLKKAVIGMRSRMKTEKV